MPALMQDDEPLDERQGQHDLADRPEDQLRSKGQADPEAGRDRHGGDRQGAGEIRRAQMLEFRWARPGLGVGGHLHDSSFLHDA
jgi:hypothetical protein